MDHLEKFFEKNRAAFDEYEPREGHMARFEARMNEAFGEEEPVPVVLRRDRSMFLRIAAGFVILFTFSFFVYDFARTRSIEREQGMALTGELGEAVNYYDNAAASGLGTIRNIACCGKEKEQIYSMASGELKTLDANAVELKAALKANPGDERIQSALIRNQQMKEKIMNEMIGQMNKIKK
jgi:hypothetical protein